MQAVPLSADTARFAPPPGWTPLSPDNDPWDPIRSLQKYGRHRLTSVELTVTHLCNMRCEHCAVGDSLTMKEGPHMPLDTLLRRLDEVECLETVSLTGGFSGSFRADVRTHDGQHPQAVRRRFVRFRRNHDQLSHV